MRRNIIRYVGIISPLIVIFNDLLGSREHNDLILLTVVGLLTLQIILVYPLIRRNK